MKKILLLATYAFLCSLTINAATLTVTKTADTNDGVCDSDCSLREAIAVSSNGDTIEFSTLFNNQQTILLNGTELSINKSLTINGTGADKLSVDAGFISRALNIVGSANVVSINGLKISNGFINNPNDCNGGGIKIDAATVNIDKTIVDMNFATSNTGANCGGGGIYNTGTLTLSDSTISNNMVNSTGAAIGGGLINGSLMAVSTVNVTNSTFSGNIATTGGGIYNNRIAVLTGVTITNNNGTGGFGFGGVTNSFFASTTLRSTIIAGNQNDKDAFGNFISSGYNLIGDGTNTTSITQPTDQVGTAMSPIDPLLGVLANNGGTTLTYSLLPNSPAIDKGNSFGSTADQRGQNRAVDNGSISNAVGGDGTDIGAFEALAPTAAGVTISGRVFSNNGRKLSRVIIEMSDFNGNTIQTRTNHFGYFKFSDVEVGQTYIFNAYSKEYQFAPQIVSPNENITDLSFTPQINQLLKKYK